MFAFMWFVARGVVRVLVVVWLSVLALNHSEKIPALASGIAQAAAEAVPDDARETLVDVTSDTLGYILAGAGQAARLWHDRG